MRSSPARAAIVALSVLALGLTSEANARAQQPAAPPPATASGTKTAQQYYEEGAAAFQDKKWEQARIAFLNAWHLKQHWQIAANLGQAEFNLGRYRDAAEHLAYFLHEATGAPPADRQRLQDAFDKARKKIGSLRISASAAGAEVLVDGASVGRTPLKEEIFVDPGSRVVEARLDGVGTAKETASVTAGGKVEVNLRLAQGVADAKGGMGNGSGVAGAGASADSAAAVGSAGAGAPGAGSGTPEGPARGVDGGGANKTWVIVGASAAAAMAVIGTGFAAGSEAKRHASITAGSYDNFYHLQHQKVAFGWVSLGSFVLAGAAAIGTTIYALRAGQPKAKLSISADIVVGSQGIGATFAKTW